METLEGTLKEAHSWALKRIEVLSDRSLHDCDMDLLDNAAAISQEFSEWLNLDNDHHDVISLEYIGDGSEYDG